MTTLCGVSRMEGVQRVSSMRILVGGCGLLRPLAAALLLLTATPGPVSAQYQIQSWTTEHGLPQGTIVSVAQTADGFLWLSTFGGLARFDGVTFRVFDTVTNPELPNSRLGALRVDADGLWVKTDDGVLMRFRGERFQLMGTADGLPARTVGSLTVDEGHLVADTANGTVIWKDGRFTPYTRPRPTKSAGMAFIGESPSTGARWFRDAAGRVHRFEGERITRTEALPKGNLHEDRAGRIWMLGGGGTVLCFSAGGMRRYDRRETGLEFESLATFEDPDGTLWFAEPAGLIRFRDGVFTSYTTANGLPDNHIRAVFRDRESTHWVSTNNGLAQLTERPILAYATADGLAANNTYPLLQDRRGDIWIGGWQGLTRYRNGVFDDLTLTLNLRGFNILSLLEDDEGWLWVGTGGLGIYRIDITQPGPLTIRQVTRVSGPEAPGGPLVIYQARGGDIWLGGGGATRYHDGIYEPSLKVGGTVNTFFEDVSGTIWIGSDAGLARYDRGVVTRVGEAEGFSGRRVRVIRSDAAGALWIGTYDSGLFRYRDGRFTRFTSREGLPTNGAFEILEDDQARFWICSNAGIYRVARSDLDDVADGRRRSVTAVRYGRDDGMRNQECNGLGRPAGIRAADGRLWFPTQGGVAVVDPAAIVSRPPPPVSILDVKVAGVSVANRDQIEIRSGSTSTEVSYTALTFVRPELAQFKYRMEGFDTDWVDAGTERTARYTRLPFGSFRFRVIAANRDGVWNEEGASVAIVVVPPFYRTTWFAWLMAGLVALAAFGAHLARVRTVERRQAIQEAFARQLIESQEADRTRIASGLHDGLQQSLIVLRNWALLGQRNLPDDDATKKRFVDMEETAAQALSEVREVVHDLVPYQLERLGLAASIREMVERSAAAAGLVLTCDITDVPDALSVNVQVNLFRVLQEAVNNIVKHAGARHIWIGLRRDDRIVTATVRDDGHGFTPGAVSSSSGGTFGMVGMGERTRLMGGRLIVDSATGRGTTITVEMPIAIQGRSL